MKDMEKKKVEYLYERFNHLKISIDSADVIITQIIAEADKLPPDSSIESMKESLRGMKSGLIKSNMLFVSAFTKLPNLPDDSEK